VEDPEEVSLNTVEAGPKGPASQRSMVAGGGFEPPTFGLGASTGRLPQEHNVWWDQPLCV